MTDIRYRPHHHADSLGQPQRAGEVAICGCGKVVKAQATLSGEGYWQRLLWPWSWRWRRRLKEHGGL